MDLQPNVLLFSEIYIFYSLMNFKVVIAYTYFPENNVIVMPMKFVNE